MKKSIVLLIYLSLFLTLSFAAEPTMEQKQAVFMMNYAQYATYKIKTYNNVVLIEDEYFALNNNMNLELIKDTSSVNEINALLNLITQERITNKNSEILKTSIEKKMSQAVYKAIPNATAIFYGPIDPFSLVLNTIRTASNMYLSYQQTKNALSEEYDNEMWKIDQNRLISFNTNYQNLNSYSHSLIQHYGISDSWRLNEQELEPMFKIIKDSSGDKIRKYNNFKDLAKNTYYEHFPLFWYHIAMTASEAGYEQEALNYYQKFEKENIPIFRYDYTACDAYKGKISILVKDIKKNKKEIIEKLDFIQKNTSPYDKNRWRNYYYCALVYQKLGDTSKAKSLLDRNIRDLSSEIENNYFSSDNIRRIYTSEIEVGSSYQEGLEMSRSLLLSISNDSAITLASLSKQFENDSANYNEFIYYFGKQSKNQYQSQIKKMISNISLDYKVSSEVNAIFDCVLSTRWMLNYTTTLDIYNSTDYITSLFFNESENKKLAKVPNNDKLKYSANVKTSKKGDSDKVKKSLNNLFSEKYWYVYGKKYSYNMILKINHPLYPVKLYYHFEPSKTTKKMMPVFFEYNGEKYEI